MHTEHKQLQIRDHGEGEMSAMPNHKCEAEVKEKCENEAENYASE